MKKIWRGLTTGLLGISMLLGSLGSVSAAPVPKDIQGHWAQAQLQEWLNKGYLGGYPDGTVKPNKAITRAEYVALVNRLFGFTETASISFTDLKSSNWSYIEVSKAVKAGYIGGYENHTFRPNNPLTRQEAAVITAKLLQLNTNMTTLKFKDSSQFAGWSRGAIAAAADKKIINGYPDGTFGPKKALTRAEAVGIIGNSVVYKPSAPGGAIPTPVPTTTPTATPTATPSPTVSPTPVPTWSPGGGSSGGGGGGVISPSVTNATYGHVGSVTADVYLTPSVTGEVYYAVVPYTSSLVTPSANQIKDGQAGAGVTVVNHGSKAAIANATVSFSVYGLQADTEYAVFAALTDGAGNWSAVTPVRLKTESGNADSITLAEPRQVGTVTADVYFKYGQAGGNAHEVRYVVLPENEAVPTAAQVAAGQNSTGAALAAPWSGSVSVPPGTPYTQTLTGLSAGTGYKVYLVSGSGSNWSSVEVVRFQTQRL